MKSALPLLACIVASSVALTLGLEDHVGAVSGGLGSGLRRGLLQFRQELVFPYARCKNYDAAGEPYVLLGPAVTTVEDGLTEFTFIVKYRGPVDNPTYCYSTLEKQVHKLMINIFRECQEPIKVAKMFSTFNNKSYTSRVDVYPSGGRLSISALKMDSASLDGAVLKIRASSPCDSVENMFLLTAAGDIEYSFTEASAHTCCPRMNPFSPPPSNPTSPLEVSPSPPASPEIVEGSPSSAAPNTGEEPSNIEESC
mmetsp:Transcript_2016/g.3123  ORF Transcript_2016/g.3123 Transcript_2016/m.3123 type:complete len:254 (+) Transcript_2016:137-898(+)|eukprot:CAMPEP_0119103682 /NCGR_PEP_ID=MMETSP1180-20130426/2075_1 /TAXON_ID=3052 ORGANISM="Chlamydomonas cf sp, Strain CCMP681" /NCGR_SAMPLE_ID=MMETSP1180 /ASSEMBLY_ACC=CAM_ASM_000741 /LENGTH=253 /DNA_ID=CAMNT_0007088251 /DNA_START=125 /DNA_END=886 /DNA_ORIENTATION=-